MNLQLKLEITEELDAIVKVIADTVDTEEIYLLGSFSALKSNLRSISGYTWGYRMRWAFFLTF